MKTNIEEKKFITLNQTAELDYTSNGNPKFLDGKTLSYDALDRLIAVDEGLSRVVYTYDALDRRLVKKVYKDQDLIEEIYYLFDGLMEIGSFDAAGRLKELRVLGKTPKAEIGSAVAFELKGEIYIPSHDLFGNVAVLYSPSKNTLEHYNYTAFGEELFLTKTSPWRFSSKRTDEETGLVYYEKRFYWPIIGRWLTS